VFTLSLIITTLFDVLLAPFGSHRAAGLFAMSLLMGAALTLLYRATSDEARIRRTRDVFKARVLEMRLYPDDFLLITRALLGAIASQGAYLRAAARPIIIVALVAVPVFLQLEARFGRAPLASSGSTVVTARLKTGLDPRSVPTALSAGAGLRVDDRSVRVPTTGEVIWRVDVEKPGRHAMELRAYDLVYRFDISARADGRALGRERRTHSPADGLLHVGLPSIPADSPLGRLEVAYPEAHYRVFRARCSWLGLFFLGSLAGAAIPAWLLRVAL